MTLSFAQVAEHMGAALLAGALIGTERSFHGRAAGFRTHALVCMASGMLMLVTLFESQWLVVSEAIRMDPTRMAQGIMTGIGFLGAGVIFKDGLTVRGLTTAASIWTTAAIGILMGIGLYAAGTMATALTLGVLSVFRQIEMRFPTHLYAQLAVCFDPDSTMAESALLELLHSRGFVVSNLAYRLAHDGKLFEYSMSTRTVDPDGFSALAKALRTVPSVRGFTLVPTAD